LGPKSKRRIYTQSGLFIISPLKEIIKDEVPVLFHKEQGYRTRLYISKRFIAKLIKDLEAINIKRHTMYPEIKNVAIAVKKDCL
jgi:hypothetical protein